MACSDLCLTTDCEVLRAGYLPGMLVPNIRFFQTMSLLYTLLVVAWVVSYAKHTRTASLVHPCATAAIVSGLLNVALWWAWQC